MICTLCKREVLPHQCAHGGGVAVCYNHGPSGYDPAWLKGEHRGTPIYELLGYAQLYAAREAFVVLLRCHP